MFDLGGLLLGPVHGDDESRFWGAQTIHWLQFSLMAVKDSFLTTLRVVHVLIEG